MASNVAEMRVCEVQRRSRFRRSLSSGQYPEAAVRGDGRRRAGMGFPSQLQSTIVTVADNMQQAARVAEKTGFLLNAWRVEFGTTHKIFTQPSGKGAEDYITGRF